MAKFQKEIRIKNIILDQDNKVGRCDYVEVISDEGEIISTSEVKYKTYIDKRAEYYRSDYIIKPAKYNEDGTIKEQEVRGDGETTIKTPATTDFTDFEKKFKKIQEDILNDLKP